MAEYKACILGLRMAVEMNIKELLVIGDSDMLIHQYRVQACPRIQNAFVDALATLSSMIQHSDKNYIDPIEIEIRDQHAYCFHDIKSFFQAREYPESATNSQKRALKRL
ncbi:uncharacterized protein LOC142175264 [Nicotiana tabacum]|uniref:Uncharacterized protein LOC142175264 n=1 Tax=Nicotiana tabacum TaxID=4097 RepID=A0AC58TL71_TOBAC